MCKRCQWGQFYSKIVPGELKHSRGDRKQKSYLKMTVAWPEPDMGLLIQTYENRWVLTKSNVKGEKKTWSNFQFCGYWRMQRAGRYLELPKESKKKWWERLERVEPWGRSVVNNGKCFHKVKWGSEWKPPGPFNMSDCRWQPWWRQLQHKGGGRTTLWWGEEEETSEI